jgi:tetratricopeptide (TPR) repeat protein
MFLQVIALVPDSFRGYSNLGAAYFMKDRIPEAIDAFQKSLSIRATYEGASNLGTLYYFEDDYRRSAEAFRQARSLNEGSYQVWGNLADALRWANEPAESQSAFLRAKELAVERARINPADASVQLAIAAYSFELGQTADGQLYLQRTLALKPADPHSLFQLAVLYEHWLMNRDQALDWLEKAIERGQTWREVDHAPALRNLREDPRFRMLRGKS